MAEAGLKCDGCLAEIVGNRFLKCGNCHNNYDFLCANITEEQLPAAALSWRCVKCKSADPRFDNTNTPVRSWTNNVTLRRGVKTQNQLSPEEPSGDASSIMDVSYMDSQQQNTGSTPPNKFSTLEDTLDTTRVTEVQMLVSELRLFREEMRALTHQFQELRVAMANLNTRIDSCDGRIDTISARVEALESRVEARNSHPPENDLMETIAHLRSELNDRDQDQLLNDLEISHVPENRGENIVHIALTLSQKLGVTLTEHDIVDATRVGRVSQLEEGTLGPAPRPRLVVVRLARRAVRDQLLQAARVRRGATTEGTGLPGAPSRFYVNERLTPSNRRLFQKARELKQQHGWRYVWTRDGRIFVRQRSGDDIPKYRIRSELDLIRVFGARSV